jgi:transposase-like protein
VDSTGQTIEFLLAAKRDAAAAKRFFHKAPRGVGNPVLSQTEKNRQEYPTQS